MRGGVQWLLCLTVLALPPAAGGAGQTAAETVIAADADALIAASRRAAEKLRALRQAGEPAPIALARPENATLLRAAFDLDALRALRPELTSMHQVCRAMGEAYAALYEYGRGANQAAGLAAIQNDFTHATRTIDLCKKRTLIASDIFVGALMAGEHGVEVRDSLRIVQANLVEFTHGILLLVIAPEFSAANHAILLSGLGEEAPRIAPLLAPSARAALRENLLDAAARARGADRTALEAIAALYAGDGCTTPACRVANGI